MFDLFQKGGIVMYPLLACSLVSLTVILERSLFWIRQKRRAEDSLVNDLLELARLKKYEEIRTRTQHASDYVVKVLVCGLVHREYSISKAMEMASRAKPTSGESLHARARE